MTYFLLAIQVASSNNLKETRHLLDPYLQIPYHLGLDRFQKDLHTSSQTQHQMQGTFLLNAIICQGTAIFQLFPSKDQSLLVWWNAFLVLDLFLHLVDGIARLHFQSNGLPSQSFHEDLHTTSQAQHQCR